MSKEIIISVSGDQSRIAIVEDGDLVELYVESPDNVRTIGDIYLARIKRILPGIKAAFVDIGQKQDAFLHFSDLSDNVPALLDLAAGKTPSIPLGTAPSNDDLETETVEEQRAAKRQVQKKAATKKQQEAAAPESTSSERATSPSRPTRRRGSKRPSAAPIAAVPAILPADSEAAATPPSSSDETSERQKENAEKQLRRRGRRRSRRSSSESQKPEQNTATSTGDSTTADSESGKAPTRRRRARPRPNPQQKTSDTSADTSEAQQQSRPETPPASSSQDENGSSTVLASNSRFLIDLTSQSGKVSREEEEEEEQTSSRSVKRRGARTRKPSAAKRKNNQAGSKTEENSPRPETYLKQDQKIIVKISKEPIGSKGSRVSTDISFAGRFLVLIPAADYVAVSKKIDSSKERRRLRSVAREILPEGFGLIVRTVAEGRDSKTLELDLQLLLKKWERVATQLKKTPQPPAQLYQDVNMVSSIIRDLFSEDYDRIVVDDSNVYRNIKSYVQAVAPQMVNAVQLHQRKEPVFRTFKIERDVRTAFEKRVSLPGGGYLFIEHTEAMHVVDVNSGRAGKGLSQEENALKVNIEAAREIAKQLRLRDLGGIICIDFIDMRSDAYRKKVYDEIKKAFRRDRAVTKLLPMSDFGVIEITRQRLRPSITTTLDVDDIGEAPEEETFERYESPDQTVDEVTGHIAEWLATYKKEVQDQHRHRPILLRVHPLLASYLTKGVLSTFRKWKWNTGLKLVLDEDERTNPLTFSIRDQKSGKNLTRRYDPQRRKNESSDDQ